LLLEIVYAGKIKRKRRTKPSDQAVEEKGIHWSWINAMQKIKTVKRSFLDQQAIGSLKNQHKDKTFLYLFSISVSKFFLVINFLLINVIWFKLLLLMVKISKIKFSTAAEKQPIVSSKQPIVLSLTALWRNWFNCFFNFYLLQINLKERIFVKWSVLKAGHVQKEVITVIKEYIPKSWKFKCLND